LITYRAVASGITRVNAYGSIEVAAPGENERKITVSSIGAALVNV
jgi:hypothetical protein